MILTNTNIHLVYQYFESVLNCQEPNILYNFENDDDDDGVPSRTGRYAVIGCKLKQNANEDCNSCATVVQVLQDLFYVLLHVL